MRGTMIYISDDGQVRGLVGLTVDELTALATAAVIAGRDLHRVTEAEGADSSYVRVKAEGGFIHSVTE